MRQQRAHLNSTMPLRMIQRCQAYRADPSMTFMNIPSFGLNSPLDAVRGDSYLEHVAEIRSSGWVSEDHRLDGGCGKAVPHRARHFADYFIRVRADPMRSPTSPSPAF